MLGESYGCKSVDGASATVYRLHLEILFGISSASYLQQSNDY